MADDAPTTNPDRTPIPVVEGHEAQWHARPPGLDAAEVFVHGCFHFFCSGEQLPDGTFHAVVRYRVPSSDALRTLRLGNERFASSSEALIQAREMAQQWVASEDARSLRCL